MPYLPLESSFKFTSLIIWPYQKEKTNFAKDSSLRDHIDKLVARYQFQKGSVVKNPTVISVYRTVFTNPQVAILRTPPIFQLGQASRWSGLCMIQKSKAFWII